MFSPVSDSFVSQSAFNCHAESSNVYELTTSLHNELRSPAQLLLKSSACEGQPIRTCHKGKGAETAFFQAEGELSCCTGKVEYNIKTGVFWTVSHAKAKNKFWSWKWGERVLFKLLRKHFSINSGQTSPAEAGSVLNESSGAATEWTLCLGFPLTVTFTP